MKPKYIIFFMQFFTSICLVSVGFASWTFVSGDSITASGNIVAQDVHSNDNYIKLVSSEVFRYYENGFFASTGEHFEDENGNKHEHQTVTQTGKLVFTYSVDLYNLREDLGNQENILVSFTLSHVSISTYTLINNYCNLTSVKLNDVTLKNVATLDTTNYKASKASNVYSIQMNFKQYATNYLGDDAGDDRYIPLVIEYTFDTSSVDFHNDVFPCLSNDNFEFIQKVDIDLE